MSGLAKGGGPRSPTPLLDPPLCTKSQHTSYYTQNVRLYVGPITVALAAR